MFEGDNIIDRKKPFMTFKRILYLRIFELVMIKDIKCLKLINHIALIQNNMINFYFIFNNIIFDI